MKIVTGTVDELGHCEGFEARWAGSFGCNLDVGQEVYLHDYGCDGTIAKVYSRIQTGPSGTSNYVCIDLEIPADAEMGE